MGNIIPWQREQDQLGELPVPLARDHSVFTVSHLGKPLYINAVLLYSGLFGFVETRHLINIINVLERHHFPSTKWYKLGFHLRLRKNTLDVIGEGKHKDDPGRCLLECLDQWLKRVDGVDEPTWDLLINALKDIGEVATSENIKRTSK